MSKKAKRIRRKIMTFIFFNAIVQWVLALLIAGVIWTIYLTSKRKYYNLELVEKFRGKPVVFVFYHGRSAMLSPLIKSMKIPAYCITSQHADGRMMAKLQRLFGLRAIYGSGSKGALNVLREGVRVTKDEKSSIVISVDGPSGPALTCHEGALYFAKMSGAPIIPCCFSASRAKMMDRWDRYLIPKLFGTLTFELGHPIYIDSRLKGAEFEQKRKEVESVMVEQLARMDAEFNLPVVEYGIGAGEYKDRRRQQKSK